MRTSSEVCAVPAVSFVGQNVGVFVRGAEVGVEVGVDGADVGAKVVGAKVGAEVGAKVGAKDGAKVGAGGGHVTSGGGQAAGAGPGPGARAGDTACMSLWTLLFTRREQGGCAARLVGTD